MPSGKAPALDGVQLKFRHFLDWIMPYFIINILQEEDKEGGDSAATTISQMTDVIFY